MAPLNRRVLEWLCFLVLLTTVLLSWGYVIYATRLAAQWQLKDNYPTQLHNF
ncbi:small integral membrane protein 27 [Paroedura picta]|uniref:small integral membrane protein 27 n=1 Tax=Paroedura picta TaxID=143630 RepID=UPI0040567EE3